MTLIWIGFLGVFQKVGEGGKFFPFVKLFRIMLETWNLVRNYKHIFRFRKYACYYQDHSNLLIIAFSFAKKSAFLGKFSPFIQSNTVKPALDIFSSFFRFSKIKGYCWWKCKFSRPWIWSPASKFFQIGHKSTK